MFGQTLYSDVDSMLLDAVLGQHCMAVGDGHSEPGSRHVARVEVPAGSLYLTLDAAGRQPLWASARLSLVHW